MNKTYAVFGLGRYGMAVAKELASHGKDVLAIDIDESIVNSAISERQSAISSVVTSARPLYFSSIAAVISSAVACSYIAMMS